MINTSIRFLHYCENSENLSCEYHGHPCTEIVMNFAGSGTMFMQETSWDWIPGSIHIYQPGTLHRVEKKDVLSTEFCIGLNGLGVEGLPVCVFIANEILLYLFGQLQYLFKTNCFMQKERIEVLVAMICIELQEQKKEPLEDSKHITANTIRDIIDTNFNNKISVSGLASGMYISEDYLRQVFKKEYGLSPLKYTIQKRIDYACRLFTETPRSVKSVAEECGFSDQYYFSKLFKKITGMSPSSWCAAKRDI